MRVDLDTLHKLKIANSDGSLRSKENTITFQEAYRRCRRFISDRDEEVIVDKEKTVEEGRRESIEMIDDFVRSLNVMVDGYLEDTDSLSEDLKDAIVFYGIITDLVDPDNDDVSEIRVNGLGEIFYEENGKLRQLDKSFKSKRELEMVYNRLVEKGDRLSHSTPFVNTRSHEGWRINAVHSSITKNETLGITIRKQRKIPINEKDLLENGTLTKNMLDLLKLLPRSRSSWFTVGSTGSGKTVLNNVLLPSFNPTDRAIYIENPAELRPEQYDKDGRIINDFLQLEARTIDNPKPTDPTMYNLSVNALRQTPDIIGLGEVRYSDEFDVALSAARSGHTVFSTFHSDGPVEALDRFLMEALKENDNVSPEVLMRDICSSFDFIIAVRKYNDGSRRVSSIAEILRPDGDQPRINEIYKYVVDDVEESVDPETGAIVSKIHGRHVRMNPISPAFAEKLHREGVPRDRFEFFTSIPEKVRDKDTNEVLLDALGLPVILEKEPEYRHVEIKYDMEELLELKRLRDSGELIQ